MMNLKESMGEPSCKRQENGDVASGTERPLKKARFAWQVKGKYHLKTDSTDTAAPGSTSDIVTPESSSQNQNNIANTEQNLEILGDYLLKQDFNTLDSVSSNTDKSLHRTNSNVTTEKLDYPRYVSENTGPRTYSHNRSEQISMVPMPMVATRNYNEDQCIARWQSRQMAKGFVDNTINRVLDSWMIAPLPADMDNNRFLALDVAEFINNLPGDNSIENEGILMAISAHGLQNNSSSINSDSHIDEQLCSSSSKGDAFSSRSSSPVHNNSTKKLNVSSSNISPEKSDSFSMTWTYEDENEMNHSDTPFSLFPEASPLNFENETQNSNIEFDDSTVNSAELLATSHYDFMDAAVSFAIQNKGLTSFGTDYG